MEPSQQQAGAPSEGIRFHCEAETRRALEELLKCDLPLQPRQSSTQTEMDARPKSEMTVGVPAEIQFVRVPELLLVSVCRSKDGVHHLAARDRNTGQGHFLPRIALGGEIHRSGVAEQLFYGRRHKICVSSEQL